MARARLHPPLRHLLVEYLQATRALHAAARHGDLERLQRSLDARQEILEQLHLQRVAAHARPRVRRVMETAERGASRARDALGAAGGELAAELQALCEHRQRGSAFRHSVMAPPAAGTWLDCTT